MRVLLTLVSQCKVALYHHSPIKVEARSFHLTPLGGSGLVSCHGLCFSSLCDQDLLVTNSSWVQGSVGHNLPGGQIPIGHTFWRWGSIFPFLFALGHISKVLTQWPFGHSSILERRDSSEIPQLVCVSLRGRGGGVATWGACPAPLWRGSTQACVWSQWCPVLSCAWVILSFFLTHWSPQFTPPVLYQAWKSSQDCVQPPPEIFFGPWMKIQSTGLSISLACRPSYSGQGVFFLPNHPPQIKPSLSNERTDIFTPGRGQDGHRLGRFHRRNNTLACGSMMVQHQSGTCDALGSIPGTKKEKEWKLMLDLSPSFFSTPEQVEDPNEFLDLRRSGIST